MKVSFDWIVLLPSWLAMAWLTMRAKWFWAHRPDLQFGWIVLMLCAYLIWEAWEAKPPLRPSFGAAGLLTFATGILQLFLTQIYQVAFGMNAAAMCGLAIGCLLVVAGNLSCVFGSKGLRRFGFPFAFILVALPMPSIVQGILVGSLKNRVAWLNVELLNLFGIPAQQAGNVIQLASCQVGVDEACSGILSLQASVMATLFIGYLSLKGASTRLLLFGSGLALALLGNVIRSFYLSWTANQSGLDALKSVHDGAGWSILAFTAFGVTLAAWVLGRWEKTQTRRATARNSPSPSPLPTLETPSSTHS